MFRVGNKTIERFEVAGELNSTKFSIAKRTESKSRKKDLSHGQRKVLSTNGSLSFCVDYFFCAV